MTWVILLIQLIPTIVEVITKILDLINSRPTHALRQKARRQLFTLAQRHVEAHRTDTPDATQTAVKELQAFHDQLKSAGG